MALKEGDILVVDLEGRDEKGNIFDSTKGETGKKLYGKEGPILLIWGKAKIIKGLSKALGEMKEGEEKTITLKPEDAFGKRDPSLIKKLPLSFFKEKNINVFKGAVLDFNGITATVKNIANGRVILDFNHPLSGKTVTYNIKLHKVIQKDEEKIKAVLEYMDIEATYEIKKDEIVIKGNIEENKKNTLKANLQILFPEKQIKIMNGERG